MPLVLRDATPDDASACARIYAPYVENTVITFETQAPDAAAMAARIADAQQRHAWVVAEEGGVVIGYAYGGPFKMRAAYRWACEVSIYLETGRRRTGAGRMLYALLFDRLTARGFRTAVAGMTLPNPASEGLHRALGFERVGVYRRIGWKHDAWQDVAWTQLMLSEDPGAPPETG